MLGIGTVLYVMLLLINAMAVLNEDRFLARSTSWPIHCIPHPYSYTGFPCTRIVGWGSSQMQPGNRGFGQPYAQAYQQDPYGAQDIGVKGRLINLIGAVRTLMRSEFFLVSQHHNDSLTAFSVPLIGLNLIIVVYELVRP